MTPLAAAFLAILLAGNAETIELLTADCLASGGALFSSNGRYICNSGAPEPQLPSMDRMGTTGQGNTTADCNQRNAWCGTGLVPPSRGGLGVERVTWGFSVQMETGPTVRVGRLATRDACWRVHKRLHDDHPEWVLGDCEVER